MPLVSVVVKCVVIGKEVLVFSDQDCKLRFRHKEEVEEDV